MILVSLVHDKKSVNISSISVVSVLSYKVKWNAENTPAGRTGGDAIDTR